MDHLHANSVDIIAIPSKRDSGLTNEEADDLAQQSKQ